VPLDSVVFLKSPHEELQAFAGIDEAAIVGAEERCEDHVGVELLNVATNVAASLKTLVKQFLMFEVGGVEGEQNLGELFGVLVVNALLVGVDGFGVIERGEVQVVQGPAFEAKKTWDSERSIRKRAVVGIQISEQVNSVDERHWVDL
jgi:hypothetical protein